MQPITLWYKYNKQSDSYSYNHLSFTHSILRFPIGSTPEISKQFIKEKWLKDYAYLDNKVVIYQNKELNDK